LAVRHTGGVDSRSSFLISAKDGSEISISGYGRLIIGQRALLTQLIEGSVNSTADREVLAKENVS
jgi:hypothetical protein